MSRRSEHQRTLDSKRLESQQLRKRIWTEPPMVADLAVLQDYKTPIPSRGGLSGRLSELSGLGLVAYAPNETELVDEASMKFRAPQKSRWYLTRKGIARAN